MCKGSFHEKVFERCINGLIPHLCNHTTPTLRWTPILAMYSRFKEFFYYIHNQSSKSLLDSLDYRRIYLSPLPQKAMLGLPLSSSYLFRLDVAHCGLFFLRHSKHHGLNSTAVRLVIAMPCSFSLSDPAFIDAMVRTLFWLTENSYYACKIAI